MIGMLPKTSQVKEKAIFSCQLFVPVLILIAMIVVCHLLTGVHEEMKSIKVNMITSFITSWASLLNLPSSTVEDLSQTLSTAVDRSSQLVSTKQVEAAELLRDLIDAAHLHIYRYLGATVVASVFMVRQIK